MSLWQRYLFGMLSGAGSVVVKAGLNLLVIPILLAHLGLDAFGLYILLIGILELSLLMDLGVSNAIVRLMGGEENPLAHRKPYLMVGHVLFGFLALLFLGVGLLCMPFFQYMFNLTPELENLATLAFGLIVLEAALTIYTSYFQTVLLAHCAHQWTNVAETVYNVLANLGALAMLFAGFHLPEIIAVRLLAAVVRLAMVDFQALRLEPDALRPGVPFRFGTLKEVVKLSAHAMAINLSIIVSHKIDVFVIALFLPIGMVGIYEIVFRFLGLVIQICVKLGEGVLPLYTRMAALGQRDDARQLFLRMSCFLNFVACMLVMLFLSFYGELLATFSAGKVSLESTLPVLTIAVPIILSGVLQMQANAWLFTWGHQRFLTASSLLAAVANLILSLLLVKPLGLVGVALGTAVPQLIQHQGWLIRKTCQEMDISLRRYTTSVHGAILVPVLVSYGWVQLWRPVLMAGPHPLIPMGLIAASALGLGGLLWFWLTASPLERKIVSVKLVQPLRHKMELASHG